MIGQSFDAIEMEFQTTMYLRLFCLLVILSVAPSFTRGREPSGRGVATTAVATFPISTDGDRLLVPVKIEDKTYRFLLDTGIAISVFNRSLPLGRLVKSMSGKGSGGANLRRSRSVSHRSPRSVPSRSNVPTVFWSSM